MIFNALEILSKIPAKNFALSLPVISNHADQKILDKIIEILPKESFLYVQNVSGLFASMSEVIKTETPKATDIVAKKKVATVETTVKKK